MGCDQKISFNALNDNGTCSLFCEFHKATEHDRIVLDLELEKDWNYDKS